MAPKILVVYYSRTGTVGRVASHLADQLGADLEPIEEERSRAGWAGYVQSALEAIAKGLPTIHTDKEPRKYDLVVVGTPVWTGTMASPVRAYLMAHRGEFARSAFFAVMAGRGGEQTVREMQIASGAAKNAPTIVLTQSEARGEHLRAKCAAFVQSLEAEHARHEPSLGIRAV